MSSTGVKLRPDLAMRIERKVTSKQAVVGIEKRKHKSRSRDSTTLHSAAKAEGHPLVTKLSSLLQTYESNKKEYAYCFSKAREMQRLLSSVRKALLEHEDDLMLVSSNHGSATFKPVRRKPRVVELIQKCFKELTYIIEQTQDSTINITQSNCLLRQFHCLIDMIPKKDEYSYSTAAIRATADNKRAFAEMKNWPADDIVAC